MFSMKFCDRVMVFLVSVLVYDAVLEKDVNSLFRVIISTYYVQVPSQYYVQIPSQFRLEISRYLKAKE